MVGRVDRAAVVSALRWLAQGDSPAARHAGTTVDDGRLVLGSLGPGFARHGVAVLRAGRPDPAQVDSATADRWRRVVVRLAEPVPQPSWLRIWTRVEPGHAAPPPPDPASDLGDHAPAVTAPGVWRAAAADALDVRVLCHEDGDLWVAVELGGLGATTPAVADLLVQTGTTARSPRCLSCTAKQASTPRPTAPSSSMTATACSAGTSACSVRRSSRPLADRRTAGAAQPVGRSRP